ncbi:family 1 glycosylhydrolase, partial [Deinococcus pimensis]|uniref:family 1 glycosylhydrolase n=1 Tax=Deinococcus pimensis TaxID=309888 RepID=UPI0005EBF172
MTEGSPARAGLLRARDGLELWAGVECTVNRVGDDYLDQCEMNGHAVREGDVALLAGLGASRLRFPVLWEKVAPEEHGPRLWAWSDSRLGMSREAGVRPIVGLVHHGSGPRHTSLVDPAFPEKLAAYAREVAQRYPWVDAWTPVNEPLTTARFSGLYGHWYPHERSGAGMWRTLLSELRGTVLAMRAVREVNPRAALVQTEDLGKVHSTSHLRYQADFENERRWLSLDLLAGRVDERHPLWRWLRACGASERELAWFSENPCPPDVLGLNVYVTSERFLDERLDRYPPRTHGGNGHEAYADVEAIRVLGRPLGLFGERLRDAWDRYGRPVAITEAHLGCTREEQLRWLAGAWDAAGEARADGVDVVAVTPWAAFGSFDWNSLLTRFEGHYEPGLWDVRAPEPRPTALVTLARELAAGA